MIWFANVNSCQLKKITKSNPIYNVPYFLLLYVWGVKRLLYIKLLSLSGPFHTTTRGNITTNPVNQAFTGVLRTENPRVDGSIPPLGTMLKLDK